MPKELEKSYDPKKYEEHINQVWENSGFFNPDNLDLPKDAPAYTIILPPPNITDKLHLGHAAMIAIEDLFIRYHRMKGFRALWLPGTDHAAIATQTAVEKKLMAETGQTRHDLGREQFLKKVNEFIAETQAIIIKQIKKLGASLDWSRLAFTLDEARQKAVATMFVRMYESDLIYRGERIVNWCPHCQSTLADDEVEYQPQTAQLYTFKYSDDFPLAISTTRPETKLGDSAVAVNPKDDRYKKLIGQTFTVDFIGQPLKIKIIADRQVDTAFGTGALGVTPAHSFSDWQLAEKNDLPIIKVIDEQGKIRDGFGKFSGLSSAEARSAMVEALTKQNLLIKTEEVQNNLSVCYRCATPIEPLPSEQWFVAVNLKVPALGNKSLKQAALEVVKDGKIEFIPERFSKRYSDWMAELHDWCVSRQIWFGHQVPVWYCQNKEKKLGKFERDFCSEPIVSIEPVDKCPHCGGQVKQDSDTLDTWFSSGMWSFSTLGWPSSAKASEGKPAQIIKSGDLARFHPTQLLETGYEIITLWVSRMIMMSLFAVGEIPFEKVYLHGMVLDKNGKKMSKSKGNGIDPLDMISAYGTDATRLSLLVGVTAGNDFKIDEAKIASFRNFANKLWNISRYILSKTESVTKTIKDLEIPKLTVADLAILAKLKKTVHDVDYELHHYRFSAAAEILQAFTWDDLADWYLEIAKFETNLEKPIILKHILKTILLLWHPFMPFVSETIWSSLGESKLLLVSQWPIGANFVLTPEMQLLESLQADQMEQLHLRQFAVLKNIIIAIRNARSRHQISPDQKLSAVIAAGKDLDFVQAQAELIKKLRTGLEKVEVVFQADKIDQAIYAAVGKIEIYLTGSVDPIKEKARLIAEVAKMDKLILDLTERLNNPEFKAKAPAKIVEAEQGKLVDWQLQVKKLRQQLKDIG